MRPRRRLQRGESFRSGAGGRSCCGTHVRIQHRPGYPAPWPVRVIDPEHLRRGRGPLVPVLVCQRGRSTAAGRTVIPRIPASRATLPPASSSPNPASNAPSAARCAARDPFRQLLGLLGEGDRRALGVLPADRRTGPSYCCCPPRYSVDDARIPARTLCSIPTHPCSMPLRPARRAPSTTASSRIPSTGRTAQPCAGAGRARPAGPPRLILRAHLRRRGGGSWQAGRQHGRRNSAATGLRGRSDRRPLCQNRSPCCQSMPLCCAYPRS